MPDRTPDHKSDKKPPKKGKKDISDADLKLWQQVADSVHPLEKRDRVEDYHPKIKHHHSPIDRIDRPADHYHMPSYLPDPSDQIDRKIQRKLSRGKEVIHRKIDLHGLNQTKAYTLLYHTLHLAYHGGDKTVLVVTGKGGKRYNQLGDKGAEFRMRDDFDQYGGVLRKKLPEWIQEPALRGLVESYGEASKEHGGAGALYIRMRKKGKGRP